MRTGNPLRSQQTHNVRLHLLNFLDEKQEETRNIPPCISEEAACIRSCHDYTLNCDSDTGPHSIPESKKLSSSYSSRLFRTQPWYQPVRAIWFTVNHLDVVLPVWLWRRTAHRESLRRVRTRRSSQLRADMQTNNLQSLFTQSNLTEDTCWFSSPPWVTRPLIRRTSWPEPMQPQSSTSGWQRLQGIYHRLWSEAATAF